MIPTYVVVPVKNEWDLTRRMLRSLEGQAVNDVLIIDNGSADGTPCAIRSLRDWSRAWEGVLHLTIRPSMSIYEMWNHGFARAKQRSARLEFNVLMLNNDVELPPSAVEDMAYWLRAPGRSDAFAVYPDYAETNWNADRTDQATRETRGVLGDDGLFGPCFMLAGDRIPWSPLVTDLAYQWWYGDNHLAECIELAGGKQVRVVGLPVKHVNEGTAQHYPELYAKKLHDRGQWITRHQRGYGVAP